MSENENETVMEVVQDTTEETQEFTKIQASDAKEFTDEQLQSEFDRHEKMANEFGRLLQTKGYAVIVGSKFWSYIIIIAEKHPMFNVNLIYSMDDIKLTPKSGVYEFINNWSHEVCLAADK